MRYHLEGVYFYKLKVSFDGAAVETKEPAKVIEVVQHLLEPYGTLHGGVSHSPARYFVIACAFLWVFQRATLR